MRFGGKGFQYRDPRRGHPQSGGLQQGPGTEVTRRDHTSGYTPFLDQSRKCLRGGQGRWSSVPLAAAAAPAARSRDHQARMVPNLAAVEPTARAHREHRRRSAAVDDRQVAIPAAVVAAMASRMRAEDEAAEEDDRDDEDDPGDDADPRGHCGEPRAARLGITPDVGRLRWRRGGGRHGACCGFVRGRRWFAHRSEHANGSDALLLISI